MVSEPFFDNTAYFYTAASILNFNPNSKNPFVFLFLIRNYSRKGNKREVEGKQMGMSRIYVIYQHFTQGKQSAENVNLSRSSVIRLLIYFPEW